MADDVRRRLEMEAALNQIKTIQKRQAKMKKRTWQLDATPAKMIFQGAVVFAIGVLVGLGVFVLFQIVFP